jgi:hypothetical protein
VKYASPAFQILVWYFMFYYYGSSKVDEIENPFKP